MCQIDAVSCILIAANDFGRCPTAIERSSATVVITGLKSAHKENLNTVVDIYLAKQVTFFVVF